MTAPNKNNLPAAGSEGPSAVQEVHQQIYHRCIIRHVRVLDANISKLELQLKDELSKSNDGDSCSGSLEDIVTTSHVSSGSGLPEDIITNTMSNGSSCSALLDEIERTCAKRERIYAELQKNNQQQIRPGNDNGSGDAPPPPPVATSNEQQERSTTLLALE